ncbi:MAG: VWA domain-containing protein [Clostridiales bacterium]|nr:VWA domain-containing protein [Clostridiales bacterium]
MKKQKFLISILTVFFVCFMGVAFSACGEEHTHSYTQQITTQATCTEKGVITYTCSCNDTYTEEIPALGHEFTNYVSDNNATYEKDGTETAVCNRDGCEERDTRTDEGTKLVSGIAFTTLSIETGRAYSVVSNATIEFSFVEEIEVKGNANFVVSKDKYGSQAYLTKIVPLEEGDNTFYVFETINGEINEMYEITLRRRPMYTVSFEGGISSQRVEEGDTATLPQELPTKKGYNFIDWNFDFSSPVTGDLTITANWEIGMEKVVILDASASMRTQSDGSTRFERAVYEILSLADECFEKGFAVSLIFADEQPKFIAKHFSADEKGEFFNLLDGLLEEDTQCSYGSANMKSAMALAESVLEQNKDAEILLYTGTQYTHTEGVTVINVAEEREWNVAILDCEAVVEENYYTFNVSVATYNRDIELFVYCEVSGVNGGATIQMRVHVLCKSDKIQKVSFVTQNMPMAIYEFETVHVYVSEDDSFPYDDDFFLYDGRTEIKTQYASANPNMLISGALYSLRTSLQDSWDISITETKVVGKPNLADYDFYIFENKSLTALPTDGAVFLINPSASVSGFSLGETVTGNFNLTFDNAHEITKNISSTSVSVSAYTKLSSYHSSFTPVMWCGNDPVCLVKNTPTEKIVVLTFDVGASNLDTTTIPLLTYNIFDYFFPKTIEKDVFNVGEKVEINSTNGTVNLSWYGAKIEYTQFPSTFIPNVPGTYQVEQTSIAGVYFIKNFFVKIPSLESNISRTEILPQPNQVIVSVTVQEEEESRIVKIEPKNNRIEVGKTTALEVFINSTYEGQATLTLYDNEVKEKSFEIDLIKGSQMFELDYVFNVPGLHEFTFDIVKDDGTLLTKNNNFYAHITIDTEDILIIERNTDESKELVRILSENENYQITVLNILEDDIPLWVEELSVYDQVILVNIANADMPEGFDEVLHSYVYDIGGSLFTVGGNDENGEANTYNREDMYGTLYQEMLPVQAIDYTLPLGVVFIVDTSGSMMQTDYSGNTYFEQAKASLVAGLDALTGRDFVGIVLLNENASVALPMTACTQQAKILSAINELNTDGGGTVYSSAIQQAGMLLLTCKGLAKYHIIMITDGMPADASEEYNTIIENNYKNYGITFSIIGIGLNNYNKELQHAVELGGGRLYATERMEMLPTLMRGDLSAPEIKDVIYESFSVALNPEYALLYDIEGVKFLTLDGFYGTKLKDGATAILTGIYDVPIYAQWNYGNGMVGSFMCDLNGTFSENLLNDANGVLLLNKIIGEAFSMPNARIDNNVTNESVTESVVFKAALDNGGTLELTLKDENGLMIQTMILDEEADLEKEIQFIVSQIGAYTLEYIQKDVAGDIISTGELLISFST